MSDYSEHGAIPVEDAAVPDPPTINEVLRAREEAERERSDEEDSASGG